MPFPSLPRPARLLAAAATMLAVAACGHITPLGAPEPPPAGHAGPPAPAPQKAPAQFVLQAVRIQFPARAGGCPAGAVALPGGPGRCYRKLGTPVTITITSAAICSFHPRPQPGQQPVPVQYGFLISVPASDGAGLAAVGTTAADSHGYVDITAAGRTWLLLRVQQPSTGGQFAIVLPSRNRALQFERVLPLR